MITSQPLYTLTATDEQSTVTLTPYPQLFNDCFRDWKRYECAVKAMLDVTPTGLGWRWFGDTRWPT